MSLEYVEYLITTLDLIEWWNKGKIVKYSKIEGKIESSGEKEKKYWKVWWNRKKIEKNGEIAGN